MRDEPLYSPSEELTSFLEAGTTPIYIGFGSIVLEDADKMTKILIEACRMSKVRAIVSRGWSKLGGQSSNTNDILFLGDCPHGMSCQLLFDGRIKSFQNGFSNGLLLSFTMVALERQPADCTMLDQHVSFHSLESKCCGIFPINWNQFMLISSQSALLGWCCRRYGGRASAHTSQNSQQSKPSGGY
jgi:hypothetical protein